MFKRVKALTFDGRRVLLLPAEDYDRFDAEMSNNFKWCRQTWLDAGIEHILMGPGMSVPVVRVE